MAHLDGPELGGQEARPERAFALYRLSEAVAFGGDIDRASRLAERSLAAYRALGDRWGTVRVLYRQAVVDWRFAAYEKAEQALEEGMTLSRALGDRVGITLTLIGLAVCAASQGEPEKAEPGLREATALCEPIGDGELSFGAHWNLGNALSDLGRFLEALSVQEKGLALCRRQGHRRWEIVSLTGVSRTERHLGVYGKARDVTQTALTLAREFGQTSDVGTSCLELGRTALAEGAYNEAQAWLQQSIAAYDQAGRPNISNNTLVALAYVAGALDHLPQARQYVRAALTSVARTRDWKVAVQSLPAVALLLLDGGGGANQPNVERAVELYALASRYPYVRNSRWFEDVAGKELAAAAGHLPPEVAREAQKRGRARDLWATVEELLLELAQDKA
jgi:tetratricopeptide (TPR) repeat protein